MKVLPLLICNKNSNYPAKKLRKKQLAEKTAAVFFSESVSGDIFLSPALEHRENEAQKECSSGSSLN